VFSWHAYLMGEDFYQGLSGAEQTAVAQCVEISKTIHRGMTAAQDANATAILSEKGMEVVPVSPAQKAMFRDAAQPAVRPNKLDAAVAAYRGE